MRASGILMPISSLPSPYGIGTMGAAARSFVDFFGQGRAGILADSARLPHKLRRQSLSVVLDLCGQPVFYRSGRSGKAGTAAAGGICVHRLGMHPRLHQLRRHVRKALRSAALCSQTSAGKARCRLPPLCEGKRLLAARLRAVHGAEGRPQRSLLVGMGRTAAAP